MSQKEQLEKAKAGGKRMLESAISYRRRAIALAENDPGDHNIFILTALAAELEKWYSEMF